MDREDDRPRTFKRGVEPDSFCGEIPNKKRRTTKDGERVIELRVLMASKNAGAVIGKKGANINKLRQDHTCTVTVPDSTGPERILSISAEPENVLGCLLDSIPILEDYQQVSKKGDEYNCEVRILVHQSQAGCVIGRAGFKIKELREQCSTKIKVFTECAPDSSDRVVSIEGRPKNVVDTIRKIFDLLTQSPPKGPSGMGGMGGGMGGMSGGMGGMGGGMGGMGSRGGAMGGGLDMGMGGGGGMGEQDFTNDSLGGMGSGNFSAMEGSKRTQVTIPKDLAGAIIGQKGSRIRQIRGESGADIMIEEPAPGSNERVITIMGNEDQIYNAQYLLQQSVRDYGVGVGRRGGLD